MEFEQRVPCIEGTTDMSCDKCHICANNNNNNTPTKPLTPNTTMDCHHAHYTASKEALNNEHSAWTESSCISKSSISSMSLRRICLLLLIASLFTSAAGCGPGRGIGGPRRKRKLTPLVFKQHVPNMSEQTLGASGVSEGAIQRDTPKFKKLEFNSNRDIKFKDEEGTGADHVMTRVS